MNQNYLDAMKDLTEDGFAPLAFVFDGDTILAAAGKDGQYSILSWSPFSLHDKTTGELVEQPTMWEGIRRVGPTRGAAILALAAQAGHDGIMDF